jgi:hypothetical protein
VKKKMNEAEAAVEAEGKEVKKSLASSEPSKIPSCYF